MLISSSPTSGPRSLCYAGIFSWYVSVGLERAEAHSVGVQSALAEFRDHLSMRAACTVERFAAGASTAHAWSVDNFKMLRLKVSEFSLLMYRLIALLCVFGIIYSGLRWFRRSHAETFGAKIDSPIWESLGPKM